MIISREADYAIRIVRALSGGEQLTIVDISKQEDLPKPFAYKILRKLVAANIVTVYRGRNGGVELSKDVSEFSVYDIIYALDPEPYVSACLKDGYFCSVRNTRGICDVHKNLISLQESLDSQLKSLNMADIIGSGRH